MTRPAGVERLGPMTSARIGLLGVLLAFIGMGALYAEFVPHFLPADETSHAGQALILGRGELPRLDSEVPDQIPDLQLQFEIRRQTYTANHPPLYYALVAIPLRVGVEMGHPSAGMSGARLLTVLLTSIGAVATYWTARVLVPDRGDFAVLAAALAVLVPAVHRFAGVIHNDGLGLAVFGVSAAIAAELLVKGPTRSRMLVAMATACAMILTRAIGLGGVVVLAGATGLAYVIHHRGSVRDRFVLGLGRASLVVLAAAVTGGWFWVRNNRLYGDLAGSAYNLDRFDYSRRGSTLEFLTDPEITVALHRQLWGRFYDAAEFAIGGGAWPGGIVVALIVAGWLVLALHGAGWLRRLIGRFRRDAASSALPDWDTATWGRAATWTMLIGWTLLVWVSSVSYFASGGGLHGRYLFPAFPAAALLAAAGLCSLPGRRWALAPIAVTTIMVGSALSWTSEFVVRLGPAGATSWEALKFQAARNGVPALAVGATIAVAVIGTTMACVGLFLSAPRDQRSLGALSNPRSDRPNQM